MFDPNVWDPVCMMLLIQPVYHVLWEFPTIHERNRHVYLFVKVIYIFLLDNPDILLQFELYQYHRATL